MIEWRVTNTSKGGSPRGQVMPYADQRAYTDRLNTLVTPAGWTRRYTIHTKRFMQQRQASPHTISSYRDSFRQFLKFVQQRLRKPPSCLSFEEIDAPLIVAFLDQLERRQGLNVRSRNLRLTAIHSFFRYAAY